MSKTIDIFKTPKPSTRSKRVIDDKSCSPSFVIPPSPCMKKLGYGTGVNVFLLERFSPFKGCYKSPWAAKKVCSKLKDNPEYSKRLELEAKVLKSLRHPNIIGYRSYTKSSDGTACLLMESGQRSLCDIIEEHADNDLGPISPNKILKVAKCTVSALSYLHHESKLLHGDLKSANILVKGDFEEIKLCDFGVCLKLDGKLEAYNDAEYVGTECWSSPEVIQGLKISNKSDIFSFGLILWEMMALSFPHIDKLEAYNSDDSLDEIIMSQMEGKMEEDFQKHLGTRPALPDTIKRNDYDSVLEIFYACTEASPDARPSAKLLLETYFS